MHTSTYHLLSYWRHILNINFVSIVQVIVVCSSPKAKTLSKPVPVQTGIKFGPQGIPVRTNFTVYALYRSVVHQRIPTLDPDWVHFDWFAASLVYSALLACSACLTSSLSRYCHLAAHGSILSDASNAWKIRGRSSIQVSKTKNKFRIRSIVTIQYYG